jgi:hypothetical protein
MEYQEILTIYKNHGLATSRFKKRLEVAKPLKGRPIYRTLKLASQNLDFGNRIVEAVRIPEKGARVSKFEEESDKILEDYFDFLIDSIKSCKAWQIMEVKASNYSKEKFMTLSRPKKFKMIYELNEKYSKFLEYQKIADIRDFLGPNKDNELDEETLKKLSVLKLMFNNIKNEELKHEVFCLDKDFLMVLINFRKSNFLRMEDYIKSKKKKIQFDFDKYSIFFSTEDFKDIAENIALCSQTTKYSLTKVIEAFYQMSESEAEQVYLKEQFEALKTLEEKCVKMEKVKASSEDETKLEAIKIQNQKREEEAKKKQEELVRKLEEREKKQKEEKEKQKKAIENTSQEIKTEKTIQELEERIAILKGVSTAKESVVPVILSWFEREDISISKKLGTKKFDTFFKKIKQIELQTGTRSSLFFITNADKEITSKRVEELKKKSKEFGMPRLVEGAFGGYSAFRIDESGKIKDISVMSEENKQKIMYLLEHTNGFMMSRDMIDETGTDYLRYKFSDGTDKSITTQYLAIMIGRLLANEKVKKQPLKFYRYVEQHNTGIDVLLESQIKGITKLQEYYNSKYQIAGNFIKLNIDDIDKFIEGKENNFKEDR